MPNNRYVGPEYGTSPLPAIRKGLLGEPEVHTEGGVLATGSITYANNPSVNDTITINSVVFTYVAAGATGNQINISGVDLPGTLVNTRDKLLASTDVSVTPATYSSDGATKLNIVHDSYGVAGNTFTLAASADTVSAATLTGGQDTPDDTVSFGPVEFALTQGVAQNFILGDGDEAQRKFLYVTAIGAGDAVVTPTSLTGGTTLTFGTAGEYAELRFMNGSWVKTVGTGVVA